MTTTNTPEPVATPRTDAFIAKEPRIFISNIGDRERESIELMRQLERELAAERERAEKDKEHWSKVAADAINAAEAERDQLRAELAALKEALRNPTDEVIDAPRSFLLGLDAGCMTSAKMREHLRLSGVDFSMLPEWFQTGDAHLTKAGRAICILAFMRAHLLKD